MKMIELTIHTTTEASELVADVLWNQTTFGVAIADRNDLAMLRENKK
ncbi:MAG: hypothetical protein J6D37_04905 [Clostridia bacterium]|nr:hypothetical protein [Clostridia bacterium]